MTRKEYIAGEVSHREYYGMLVKLAGIRFPDNHPLVLKAKDSSDPHFNDIPLNRWDVAASGFEHAVRAIMPEIGDAWSLAGGVCIAKEAVRQAIERT